MSEMCGEEKLITSHFGSKCAFFFIRAIYEDSRECPVLWVGMNRHSPQGFLDGAKAPKYGVSKGELFPIWPRVGWMSRLRRANVEPCQRQWIDIGFTND